MNYSPASNSPSSEGRLFAWLTACCYILFTLLPDSHSLMVKWPWVAFWQIGLLCPVLWLLCRLWNQRSLSFLGSGLDWCIGLGIIGLFISTLCAEFPNQARWYGWAALCLIAALYALNDWLNTSERRYGLLITQGYLGLAFVLISLSLWTAQTLIPEFVRLASLKSHGVNLAFDFSVLELRNWAPLGHQNYVAGYLLLILPLFVGLSFLQTGWRRWLWFAGIGLGLIDLYTTSSRGGWLGLFVLLLVSLGVLLYRSPLPRLWLGLGGCGVLGVLLLLVLANNRLRTLITAGFNGQGKGELAYRMINATVGWRMGSSHPFSGIGLGSVPLLYQKYRPIWAGRESELAYQLHSTPVHLWAEMGGWGILPILGASILLLYLFWYWLRQGSKYINKTDRILIWSLYGGLIAYGVISLTDYQLDNLCISGTLVIYLAYLASIFRLQHSELVKNAKCPRRSKVSKLQDKKRIFSFFLFPFALLMIIWLLPVHRAWQLSNQGFMALSQDKVEMFVERLGKAKQLAPWEPYYPNQLGWNLGNLAVQSHNSQQQQESEASITWLKEAIAVSPYQEFGYSNLGWLLLNRNPEAATQAFVQAAKLVPAKRGVMYGLGLSLLIQGKVELAVDAIALEGLRDPLLITSPIWRQAGLKSLYPQVVARMATRYTELLQKYPQPGTFNTNLHRSRGGLFWWQGNLAAASEDLKDYGTPLSQLMLELGASQSPQNRLSQHPSSPAILVIQAWLDTAQRSTLLQKAWILATGTLPLPEQVQTWMATMENSSSFEQWLKQNAPIWRYRRERSGFGVLSRHIDGSIPMDFFLVVENFAMTNWFADLLPSPIYEPQLDLALKSWRETLVQTVSG